MNLGRYEIDNYQVSVGGVTQSRQKITYIGNNGLDIFVERYFGYIREGYKSSSMIFKDLIWSQIRTHIKGESLKVNDPDGNPQIFISLSSISSVDRSTPKTLIIIDSQYEPIFLEFRTELDCDQAFSLLNLVLEDPQIDLNQINSVDSDGPVIHLSSSFLNSPILIPENENIGPFSSEDSTQFDIELEFSQIEGFLPLKKSFLVNAIIYDVTDDRGSISYDEFDLEILNGETSVTEISSLGEWQLRFEVSDIASNKTMITININII
jgi:hypothetical protein